MTHPEAILMAKALRLLNSTPRFAPRDRRQQFDSYSVAVDIENLLRANGWNPQDPALLATNT